MHLFVSFCFMPFVLWLWQLATRSKHPLRPSPQPSGQPEEPARLGHLLLDSSNAFAN